MKTAHISIKPNDGQLFKQANTCFFKVLFLASKPYSHGGTC